jgi:hypothetical protein
MQAAHHRFMITQQLGFSVLTAPLAEIDRRALSQAWYSALHLARQGGGTPPPLREKPPFCRPKGMEKAAAVKGARSLRAVGPRIVQHREHARIHARSSEEERRAPRSRLARAIERCFLDPTRRTQRATFAVDGTTSRVHVYVQPSSAGLRLIAVCAPALRERVARALDQVRFALASRGIAVHADVSGDVS